MSTKAIDIVLLPETSTHASIIDLHQQLDNGEREQAISLGEICLPHLSLAMGGLQDEANKALFDIVEKIAKDFRVISLNFTHISQHQNSKGEQINSLEHASNTALYILHEKLIYQTRKLLAQRVNAHSFTGEDSINTDSINWVNDYFTSQSLENFAPHITLGTGTFKDDFQGFTAAFKRLAICHLGNYCTCRKILYQTELSG
jgi:2'-5' RNA ligase